MMFPGCVASANAYRVLRGRFVIGPGSQLDRRAGLVFIVLPVWCFGAWDSINRMP